MSVVLVVIVYAAAMTASNLSVAAFGPEITPLNAFFLIGLDLAFRDWLHVRISAAKMLVIILSTGLLSYVLNPAAGIVAIASAVAFTASAFFDWSVFAKVRGSWEFRSNASNIAGSAVDSILFPTLAFGALMPGIVALQFVAKVVGGAIWSSVISNSLRSKVAA